MISIAIDGPGGAGKSSVARAVACKLRIRYLDTGAMYRAVALKAMRNGVSPDDEDAVVALLRETTIDIAYADDDTQRLLLDGEDVTDAIHDNAIADGASRVGRHASVREALVALQQTIARRFDVVMDGRDIGTVVLPDATVKVFLTASPRVRAHRRFEQLMMRGQLGDRSLDAVMQELIERDEQDAQRVHSPLRQAPDAALIDSSDMDADAVVDAILALIPPSTKR